MRAPHAVRASPSATVRLTALSVLLFVACAHREGCTGDYCGTLVIATAGEPESLLPPVITSAVGLAVADQLFLKLADIGLSTDRKSTRLNSSHRCISYAVFCLKKKKNKKQQYTKQITTISNSNT